jgi:hypothetical protein
MTVKIALRLSGLDLRETEALERIPEDLAELSFESIGGVSLAVVYSDAPSPATEAADWARRIAKLMPGVSVHSAQEDLVSISDIAARCEVAAEAVRLWAVGKRRTSVRKFPAPHHVIGADTRGKTSGIYAWPEVLTWVREVLGIDPDEAINYLDSRQMAHLNAELADLNSGDGFVHSDSWPGWQAMKGVSAPITVSKAVAVTSVSVIGSGFSGRTFVELMAGVDDALGDAGSDQVPRRAACV